MKTCLVLEGGAMRGMYTAGALDVFYNAGIQFDGIIGVSAGAAFGVNYLSRQPGRVIRYNKRFNADHHYMGLIPLLKTGNIVDTEYAYEKVPRELDPFDGDTFDASGVPFWAVVTNVETGQPEYIRLEHAMAQMDVIRASASMPFVSQPVKIGGKLYLDGGVADSIPFRAAEKLGFDRVVVEPSGIFDVDEFFDILRDDPLDRWYQLGSVIAIVDALLPETLSPQAEYLLASETMNVGCVLLSRAQLAAPAQCAAAAAHLERALEAAKSSRRFAPGEILAKDWDALTDADLAALAACGYRQASCEKLHFDQHAAFTSLCFLELHLTPQQLQAAAQRLFAAPECGQVLRVKGFAPAPAGGWLELNATAAGCTLAPIPQGQEVVIVIGEGLDKAAIEANLKG